MERSTVFTKTAKGITQVNQKSASLSKDLMKVLKLIDGKSNFGQLIDKAEMAEPALEKALNNLTKDGYARVFQVRKEELDPFAEEDDFDFTAPGKMMPVATQRVIAGAANDVSELVRQQENQQAQNKARSQAHDAARDRARAEAETRAKLEAEAKAKAQAEQAAMEQARRAKEAAERAKAELEAKMREEEARRRALADQQAQARLSAEQKAKEEAESQRLAELRMKAEKEAKALAEARARAEAEAQALARARADAEAAAKRQAQEASSAEQQLKARLKEEIEARIRGEMESLLRNELEEKTRNEMRAQILQEARLAAKAEFDERLQQERDALGRAEAEARTKAEADARARADEEARRRAQAEARAAAESEARARAEEEARRLREAEKKAREEADARGRETKITAQRLEAERLAKQEAEARAQQEAEHRERRERELTANLETIAADTRVKVQAELEADLEKKAEIEGKAQAKAYMSAKVRAEEEEEERIRADQARKAKEIAEILRTKAAEEPVEEAPKGKKKRPVRRGSLVKSVLYGLAILLVVPVIAVHVVPMRSLATKVERAMGGWLHDDVAIGAATFRLLPSPHLNVQDVTVGKLLDAKAQSGRIFVDPMTLFSDRIGISAVELNNVQLTNEAVRRIPAWGNPEGKKGAQIGEVRLTAVKLQTRPAVDTFDATLDFRGNGGLVLAVLSGVGGKWSLTVKPNETGAQLDLTANEWALPLGVPLPVGSVTMHGTLTRDGIDVPQLEGTSMEGAITGSMHVSWPGGYKLESQLNVAHMNVHTLVRTFTGDVAVTGKMDGAFNVVAESPALETLLAAPRVQGKFKVSDGSISSVDLVAVMQSDAAGTRAGVTKFVELSGELAAADKRNSFQHLNLQGGVLRGSGNLEVAANSALSGRLALEIRSKVAQDRGAFTVAGTVSRPLIRRGG